MRKKQGISLIVLVITIIVMIILAAAVIVSLSNAGIIGKASDAVTSSDLKIIQQESEIIKMVEMGNYYADTYREAKLTKALLLDKINEHFKGSTKSGDRVITSDEKYVIIVGDDLSINVGVNVGGKNGELVVTFSYNSPVTELPYKLQVLPVLEGWKKKDESVGESYATYEEYANAILETVKTDAELEQLIVDGNNYWNVAEQYVEPIYNSIDQLVKIWGMYNGMDYKDFEDVIKDYGYNSVREFAISCEYVKPEGYYGDDYITYAENELKNTTKTYETLYKEGRIALAKYYFEDSSLEMDLKSASSFSEFVEIDLGIPDVDNMNELVASFNEAHDINYMTVEKMLIMLKAVETEKYYQLKDMIDGEITLKCSNGKTEVVMTGESAEFVMNNVNEVTFEAIAFDGRKTTKTFKPEHDIKPSNYTALDTKYFDFAFDSTTMTATLKGIKAAYQEVGYYEPIRYNYPYAKAIIDNGKKITDIVIPEKVINPADNKEYTITTIADYAFAVQSITISSTTDAEFTSLVLPNTITKIGMQAFYSWKNATKLTLPKSVSTIGWQAFGYWFDLNAIYYEGTETEYNNIYKDAQWPNYADSTEGFNYAPVMFGSKYTIQ